MFQKHLVTTASVFGQSAKFHHSILVSPLLMMSIASCRYVPLVLGSLTGLLLCIVQSYGGEYAKANVDKWKMWDFAAVCRDPKQERVNMAKVLERSASIVSTSMVNGRRKAVKANALISESKTKKDQGAKHVDWEVEAFLLFKQHRSCVGHFTKVPSFAERCAMWEKLWNI